MTAKKEYRLIEGIALFLACIGIQINSEVLAQWGFYFYSPNAGTGQTIYVAVGLAGTIFILGLLTDAASDPVVGLWSDRVRTRPSRWRIVPIRGRRRPFIFWGSVGLLFTGIAFWYPPVNGTSVANFIYASVIICFHSAVFFTMVAIPFNALAPEIARSDETRVRLGNWIAAGMIVGLAVAVVLPGVLIEVLDPVKQQVVAASAGEDARPVASPAGYQRMAVVFTLVSFVLFQFMVWTVKERYDSDKVLKPAPSLKVLREAISNTLFLRYASVFFLFNIGFLGVQRVLPHWVRIGMNGTPKMVSVLMAPFIVMALVALTFMPALSRRMSVKWMFFTSLTIMSIGLPFMYPIAVADVSTGTKIAMAMILFSCCGVGQGMLYVLLTPLLGQIIDRDEAKTGERREAAYQALHGLNWKASQALAVFVAAQSMSLLGNSADRPLGVFILGPLAGLFGWIGMAICWRYPDLRAKKEAASAELEALD